MVMSGIGIHRSFMSEVELSEGHVWVGELTAILPEALSAFFYYLHHIPTPHGKGVRAPLLIVHHHCVFTGNLRVTMDRAEVSSCWHPSLLASAAPITHLSSIAVWHGYTLAAAPTLELARGGPVQCWGSAICGGFGEISGVNKKPPNVGEMVRLILWPC